MKQLFIVVFALAGCLTAGNAQILPLEWSKSFGGSSNDQAAVVIQCSDGGYMLGGNSHSPVSGNKTSPSYGGLDWWVLRLDSAGDVAWQRSFGGAFDPTFPTARAYDYIRGIIEKPGQGFLLFGESIESTGGTKTMVGNGGWDAYIVCVDTNGNQLWDKSIGSSSSDWPAALQETADGGYIMVGSTRRSGSEDVWVVRLNAACNVIWERTFGGTNADRGVAVFERANGGFCVAANSASPPSGNKTSPFYGGGYLVDAEGDFWVLYLDADGHKTNEVAFGGIYDEALSGFEPTAHGGLLITGVTTSPPSGNKTSPHTGSYAGWMVCVDATGQKVWERAVGGYYDGLYDLKRTVDGGFLMAGHVDSSMTVLRLNSLGDVIWQQPLATSGSSLFASLCVTSNGGFAVALTDYPETTGFGSGDLLLTQYGSEPPFVNSAVGPSVVSNAVQFEVVNLAQKKTVIEASTNLAGWTPVHTNEQTSAQFSFSEAVTNSPGRFYRVRQID